MREEKAVERLPEEAYTVLDRLDEKMIGSELAGLVEYGAQELIYSFKIEGREVTGLSWPGAKALARWMAEKGHSLDAVEKEITQDEEDWYADVKIVDRETGLGLWGSSKASKTKRLKTGEEKPDMFARTIALNKAQRNAILAHVPDKMIAQFIKQAIDEGKVRRVPQEEVKSAVPETVVAEAGTSPPFIDQASVLETLERAGLDATELTIYPEDGRYVVRPMKFLGDVWGRYHEALAYMGFVWVKAGKESRWEISLGGGA